MHRCDAPELIEHVEATHIARVQNELDAIERGEDVRANEAVRVGDETDDVSYC
jgi:hypothetical protein